jgi:hypothetical protein
MPVDKEEIKKALDHFENDEYSEASDILKKEIAKHRDEWLEKKLDLEAQADAEEEPDDGLEEEPDADDEGE